MSLPSFFKRGVTDAQFAYLLILPLVVFAIAMVIFPVVYSLWLSFNQIDIRLGQKWTFVGLQNFAHLLKDMYIGHAFTVTLQFIFESVFLNLLLGIGLALLMNEVFPGRGIVRAIVLLPWAISEYSTAVTWRFIMAETFGLFNGILLSLGIIDSYMNFLTMETALHWVAIAYAWRLAPLGAFFLLAGLQTVPEELYKAAKIDGVGPVRRFWYISFPHLRYSIFIITVLVTMFTATATDIIIVMTGGGPGISTETVTYLIFKETFKNLNLGYASAVSYVLIAVVMVMAAAYFLLLARRRR